MRSFLRYALLWLPLACAVVAAGQETGGPNENLNPVVLRINGEPVYAAEISIVMRNVAAQVEQQGQTVEDQDLLRVASQRVIEQKLLAQEARRFGLQPDEQRVAAMMNAAIDQAGGREALEMALAAGGSTLAQLEGSFREIELGRVFISKQIRPTVQISDTEVEEFFRNNEQLFLTDEQVHARHIVIAVDQEADTATVESALARAHQARGRALAGEDFAALARELSEGPSAETGGDLGFFTRSMTEEPFAEAAFALQPGEISDVVRSRLGFHVIKVEERRPAGVAPLDQAQPRARAILAAQKTGELVGELLKTLSSTAKIEHVDLGLVPPEDAPDASESPH